jgi:hypothetical protein
VARSSHSYKLGAGARGPGDKARRISRHLRRADRQYGSVLSNGLALLARELRMIVLRSARSSTRARAGCALTRNKARRSSIRN